MYEVEPLVLFAYLPDPLLVTLKHITRHLLNGHFPGEPWLDGCRLEFLPPVDPKYIFGNK